MIPPLGKHYSLQWAEEDLNQQVKEGSRLTDNEASISTPTKSSDVTSKDRKYSIVVPLLEKSIQKSASMNNAKNKAQTKEESLNYGPLTQRLISALIEQNLMTPLDNEIAEYLDKIGPPPQSMYMSPTTMAKKLNLNASTSTSVSTLERKIKKTLIEQSILDVDENENLSDDEMVGTKSALLANTDSTLVDKDDEIAGEIRNLQNELKVVTKQCKQTLTNLLEISKQTIAKQEIKKKIAQIDTEVKIIIFYVLIFLFHFIK